MNVITLSKIYLLGDKDKIDINRQISEKTDGEIRSEISALLKNHLSFDEISKKFGKFPKQGSMSRLLQIDDKKFVEFIVSKASEIDSIKENISVGTSVNYTEDDEGFPEGRKVLKKHLARERNPRLAKMAKERMLQSTGKLECQVCNFYLWR